jgi:glutamate carboxypeptidase
MMSIPKLADLFFDVQDMMSQLRRWVECESSSYEAGAVSDMAALAADDMAAIGAKVEKIPGRLGFGSCLRARFALECAQDGGILVVGHLDTVHPLGTLKVMPWREHEGRCYGPGILDMKGGIIAALAALSSLTRAGLKPSLPVTVLLNSDEEVGSPGTRELIETEAARQRYVLVLEPARRNGGVVVGRHAVSRFKLITRGRSSHAGLRLAEGRSAIQEMAHQIINIDSLGQPDCTFSIGVVHGGQWVNCVATECEAELLSVSTSETGMQRGRETLKGLRPTTPDTEIEVVPGLVRPFWHTGPGDRALYETARRIATQLGFDLPAECSGGGSDGNFTGALGIPTLDGLGPRGDFPHTHNEHIVVESLAERGRLLAGLFVTLGA